MDLTDMTRGEWHTDDEPVTIVAHARADLDAVGSAIGLADALPGDCRVVLPDGATRQAARLGDDPVVVDDDSTTAAGATIVVDAPSTARIAPFDVTAGEGPLVVFDHHEADDLAAMADAAEVDQTAGATATLVAEFVDRAGLSLSSRGALALATGIVADTGGLRSAPGRDLQALVPLLVQAADRLDELQDLFDSAPSFSERVATFKGVSRFRGYRAGQTLVGVTEVGAHQTATAHALFGAGADVAIVLTERDGETMVVGRVDDRLADAVNLVDDVFGPLEETFGGSGGGHANAGVTTLETTALHAVRARIVDCLDHTLDTQFSELP
ncbi:DHH family phosphoesterase [Haloarchaeobius amylolyticus]|uniref:DHH family phosphoesterase n=1 Tax=Haloarchaeobius amylolyticus TaxID=1198296 RepID=UPI00226ECC63|nr:DHH family phosphoesterase [Haloarchaeobius amylolyticus]